MNKFKRKRPSIILVTLFVRQWFAYMRFDVMRRNRSRTDHLVKG